MTRNEHGWILVPNNPEDGLPAELIATVNRYLLSVDEETAFDRIDGMNFLLEEWESVVASPTAVRKWIDQYGEQGVIVERNEQGDWRYGFPGARQIPDRDTVTIPPAVLLPLIRDILEQDDDQFVVGVNCLQRFIGEIAALLFDSEKLLGHLLSRHQTECAVRKLGTDRLIQRHRREHGLEHPATG